MMHCENCGHELVGGAIICRECKHNNALRRMGELRAHRVTPEPPEAPARRFPSLAAAPATAEGRTPPAKVQSIRSSAPAAPALVAEDEAELEQSPPWRAQLKEKVRQARERRQTAEPSTELATDETHLDPNPLVASALKRLRPSDYSPAATSLPRVIRRGAQAAALAQELEFEPMPGPEPPTAPGPELKTTLRVPPPAKPLAPRRADPFTNQPAQSQADQPANRAEARDTRTLTPRPAIQSAAPLAARAERRIEPQPARAETTVEPKPETKSEARPPVKTLPRLTTPTGERRASAPPPNAPVPSAPAVNEAATNDTAPATPPHKYIETQIIGLAPTAQATAEPPLPVLFLAPTRELQAATLWVRTLAGACDFEIVGTAYLPLFASYATLDTSLGRESLAIMLLLLATIIFCYQLLTLNLAGRTFGMAMLNLHLINLADETQPPTRRQRFARALGATIAFLCPPLNLLITHLHKERRSLPDLCSRTTIIEL